MRVFVTGATGFIGSAVVRELIDSGHQVVGLARSDKAASALVTQGAQVHRGALDDLDSLQSGAAESDGVIHTGFMHDVADFVAASQTDVRAIEAIGEALVGSHRPFVVTSVTTLLTPGQLGTEDTAAFPMHPRAAAETKSLSFAERGVRVSAVRLPPSVHGTGDKGFVPDLIHIARATGVSAYVGDGANRWPAVHRLDAARLYRLALESASAGARLHAVADEAVPFRDIAQVIARHLNVPLTSISAEEAVSHFKWLAHFVSLDNPTSSARTQQQFGWHPVQPALIPDIDRDEYFTV